MSASNVLKHVPPGLFWSSWVWGGGGVFKSTKYTEDSEFDISFPGSFNFSPKTRILEGTLVGIGHMANRVN